MRVGLFAIGAKPFVFIAINAPSCNLSNNLNYNLSYWQSLSGMLVIKVIGFITRL